jgi:hypothetical protein
MTWNWKWSVTATGATALAGWLATPPLEPSGPQRRAAAAASSQVSASAVSDIEEQARRLSARLTPASDAAPPSRNPFQFGARPVTRRAVQPVAPLASPPPVDVPAPFPLRLTGMAIDTSGGTEKRIAIISGPGGVELAAAGELAAPGYQVVAVGESFAEVERTSDGVRERLTLRP